MFFWEPLNTFTGLSRSSGGLTVPVLEGGVLGVPSPGLSPPCGRGGSWQGQGGGLGVEWGWGMESGSSEHQSVNLM